MSKSLQRTISIALAVITGLIVIGGVGFFVWANTTNDVEAPALAALEAQDDGLSVTITEEGWIYFTPDAPTTRGFIFYPGGRVDPAAYSAHVRQIAAQTGSLGVIIPMPLNLAILNGNAAYVVMEQHPEIEEWFLGGHSLGGAIASRYAYDYPEEVAGLVLWAAYPAESWSLAESNVPVLSIHASLDGLATPEKIDATRALLPESTVFVAIEGGNHAGFGWYGVQRGDGLATLDHAEQQAQVAAATAAFIEGLSK